MYLVWFLFWRGEGVVDGGGGLVLCLYWVVKVLL